MPAPVERADGRSGVPRGMAGPKQPVRADDVYFEAAVCRNCGNPLDTPFCGACGQKKARRLKLRDLRRETWEHWRLFEITTARTVWRLVIHPGYVAREYVMGRRKDHMHPLKLLVFMVALLVLMLNRNRFFSALGSGAGAGGDARLQRMADLVMGYANWSFSLGIIAIFLGGYAVFRNRLGYNVVEHAVLAVYCQILVIAAILLNLLPTMFWTAPAFLAEHKRLSAQYLYAVKVLVVAVGYRQFFLVHLRREWGRLLAAVLIYMAVSWVLLRLYSWLILQVVHAQGAG